MTRRWFLPETPDVLGLLNTQMDVTIEGMNALVGWARGDDALERTLRDAEHRADEAKLALRTMLRTAFVTPIDPEDLFEISIGLDGILNSADFGIAKPERGAFAAAHRVIESDLGHPVAPGDVWFTDDRADNVAAAREFGWDAELFSR